MTPDLEPLTQRALSITAAVVPMDGFHLAQAELDRLGRSDRKGAPDTLDVAGAIPVASRVRLVSDEADARVVAGPARADLHVRR